MHDGTLNDTLKPQRGLGVHFFSARHLGGVVFDETRQRFAQVIDLRRTSAQHFCRTGVVQQGQQQVLDRDELMALLPCLDKGHVQTDFQFLGNHVNSLNALLRDFVVDGVNWVHFNCFMPHSKRLRPLVR